MKKVLFLFMGAALSVSAIAQQKVTPTRSTGFAQDRVAQDKAGTAVAGAQAKKVRKALGAFPGTFGQKEVVGNSTYDLQTNGSTPRRVLQNGNTISCGWTMSLEQNVTSTSAFADRGTGYAHYNGTAWTAAPTTRLESVRTGFGGFAGDGAGGNEMYIAHDATGYQQVASVKMGGNWTSAAFTNLSSVSQAIWPHAARSGNWLYIIASTGDSNIKSNGIRSGYFFARSNDNGQTWIDNMIPMPLVDSAGHYRGGGNSYAISASGSNVAIAFGDIGTDLTIVYSNDNGTTWNKKTVWDWPINNYDFASTSITDFNNDAVVDTIWSNDGSHSLTIDAAGTIHVAFPIVRVYKTGANTGYNFFYTTYLGYYNNVMDSVQTIDNIFNTYRDCDKDGAFGLGQNYVGAAATDPDAIYNTIGTMTAPSITAVAGTPNKVLIAYTALVDNDTTVDDFNHPYWLGASSLEGQNFRDIFVIGTNDNATTWTYPVNVSRTAHFEEMYPSTPERVSGNKLAILVQGDIEPGTILQNSDLYDPAFQNLMICQTVNIDSIFIVGADSTAPCGQSELPLAINNFDGQNGNISVYPNPATDVITLSMTLTEASSVVAYELIDMTGKVVMMDTRKNISTLNRQININNLAAGTYVLKVTTDKGLYTEKVVKH